MTLVLASGSPRRRELLGRLGYDFEVVPSALQERAPRPGEGAGAYALDLARCKASEVAARLPGATVLAADTVVVSEGQILGKPGSAEEALHMLCLLSGRTHCVVTGVAVVCGGFEQSASESALVTMRDFSRGEAAEYVSTGEPMDKAGAYAVQGLGARLVTSVRGCYETVVGLPLCVVQDLLEGCPGFSRDSRPLLCTHRT